MRWLFLLEQNLLVYYMYVLLLKVLKEILAIYLLSDYLFKGFEVVITTFIYHQELKMQRQNIYMKDSDVRPWFWSWTAICEN